MWNTEEEELFRRATHLNNIGRYVEALACTEELLALLERSSLQHAYVLGCRKAVILRHLGLLDQARAASDQAEKIAREAEEPAIIAYVLGDQAPMHEGDEALLPIGEAFVQLLLATSTPDRERTIIADEAFLQAIIARTLGQDAQFERAQNWFRVAKRTLRKYAHGSHPRYKAANIQVRIWELKMKRPSGWIEWVLYSCRALALAVEIVRQKEVPNYTRLAYKRLRARTR